MKLSDLPAAIRPPPQGQIVRVIQRDNGHCVLCGALASELHYIEPSHPLGQNWPVEAWTDGNMVLLCPQCYHRSHGPIAPEVIARCKHYLHKKAQLKNSEDRVII